jgi:hypothetical protein
MTHSRAWMTSSRCKSRVFALRSRLKAEPNSHDAVAERLAAERRIAAIMRLGAGVLSGALGSVRNEQEHLGSAGVCASACSAAYTATPHKPIVPS